LKVLLFHASPHQFDFPVYDSLASNRASHENGLLGLWVSERSDWIEGVGDHLYEVEIDGPCID